MPGMVTARTGVLEKSRHADPPRKRRWLPVSELEFVGCDSCRMTLAEYDALPDERVEFFDSEAGLAWTVRESPGPDHEAPARILVQLLREISMTRGSPIRCLGASQLRLLDTDSRQVRSIHPDEMLFLHPERVELTGSRYLSVGEDEYPDVVLEVDHSTDVRGNRLKLYEEWGFPELWVEVPNAYSPSRPRGLERGLTIHLLEGGRYVESAESRAFPGWLAEEIHRALNEIVISDETSEVLSRVGRALGALEGTGPDDGFLLRSVGDQKHAEGHAEGFAEGHGEASARMASQILRKRGVPVSPGFPAGLSPEDRATLQRASAGVVADAAFAANSEADFVARLQ